MKEAWIGQTHHTAAGIVAHIVLHPFQLVFFDEDAVVVAFLEQGREIDWLRLSLRQSIKPAGTFTLEMTDDVTKVIIGINSIVKNEMEMLRHIMTRRRILTAGNSSLMAEMHSPMSLPMRVGTAVGSQS